MVAQNHLLLSSAWGILDHYIGITNGYKITKATIGRAVMSITIHRLPAEYHNKCVFLIDHISKTVKINHFINKTSRRHYVRLCVEVDLNCSLINGFKLQKVYII